MTSGIQTELSPSDYERASFILGCEPAAIQAVAQVEAGPLGAFQTVNGTLRPVILFEGHQFYKHTQGWVRMLAWRLPNIIYPTWTNRWYTGSQQGEWNRFSVAFRLDPDAAMKSTSWGLFQIMGFNHRACGYDSVGDFVDAMKSSVVHQLDAFCKFIAADRRLFEAVRSKDWARFAYAYNGPGYVQNRYDQKMAAAYEQAARA